MIWATSWGAWLCEVVVSVVVGDDRWPCTGGIPSLATTDGPWRVRESCRGVRTCGGLGGGSVRGTCVREWSDVSRLMAAPARKVEGGDVPFACF